MKNIIIYTENLLPQHHPLTHLSKFNMGLKCFNFILNKLCRNNLYRKIVLSSYDDFTRWGYSWESSSPVRHITPVYPIPPIQQLNATLPESTLPLSLSVRPSQNLSLPPRIYPPAPLSKTISLC